jgi:hypothetical protein
MTTGRRVAVGALVVGLAAGVTACAPARTSGSEEIIDSNRYVEIYHEIIADFPERMAPGVTFPSDPAPMSGDIGIGNAGAEAYFHWVCGWEDVFLSATSDSERDEAATQLRKFTDTVWAREHYDDSAGIWPAMIDAAQLGDLTKLRAFYESDCGYYRQWKNR